MGRTPRNKTLDLSTKNAILDAALYVFAHEGLGGARIDAIAKKAGVSYGTVYYYYPTKESLFHIVTLRARDESHMLAEKSFNSGTSAYESLHNYFDNYLQWVNTSKGAMSTLLMAEALVSDGVPVETGLYMKDMFQQTIESLTDMMKKVQEEGHAQGKDPNSMAVGVISLLTGSVFLKNAKITNRFPDETLRMILE